MSFLSRKNSQPDKRGGKAADRQRADSEYDDYGYAPDAYQDDDDAWSPDEYFSPEGIKGRWAAGTRPGERSGVRGSRDDGYGYDDQGAGPQRARGGPAGGYPGGYQPGGPEYATGGYDLTDDDDAERGDRPERGGGRRRRDRGDRPERGERRLRLGRRDRSPDIWPDDEVSDEDYWASVAADRPFNSNDVMDGDPAQAADGRPMGRPSGAARHGGGGASASESRLTADRPLPGDPRVAGEPRMAGEQRSGSGRLGPPPGLAPAASAAGQNGYLPNGTAQGRPGPGGANGANSGPMARSSGPMPRSATGPTPAPAMPQMHSAPPAVPAHAASAARPAAGLAQPSFQPNGQRAASRPPERPDWGERTERMDRVTASGYPEPRHGGRPQDPYAQDNGQGVWSQDATDHDARNQGRPRRGADDDPLTSKAWSRSALVDTDGRSYRVAARRAQVPDERRDVALNEQTQTFSMPQYPADPQAATGRYPSQGQGQGGQQSGQHPYDRGAGASHPYPSQPHPARPGYEQDDERYRAPRPAARGNGGYGTGGYGAGGYGTGGYGTGGYPGRR